MIFLSTISKSSGKIFDVVQQELISESRYSAGNHRKNFVGEVFEPTTAATGQ